MERTIGGYWIKGLGIIIGIALGLLASADQAQAITCTWIGRAGTNGWNEPGNWGPDCQASPTPGIPGTGVIVRFLDGGSTSALSNQNIPGLSLGGLILNGRS